MKLVIVSPHLDDIELSMWGTLIKKAEEDIEITIIVLSTGLVGTTSNGNNPRLRIFKENIKDIEDTGNATFNIITFKDVDTIFTEHRLEIRDFLEENIPTGEIEVYSPEPDQHIDHQIASELCDVAFRGTNVRKHLRYFIPSGFMNTSNKPNAFNDVSDLIERKRKAVIKYETNFINSISNTSDRMMIFNKYMGTFISVDFAEPFNIIHWREV